MPCADLHGQLYLPQPPKKPLKAWVVVMIDYFTKAAEFAVVYDKSAASVARAFYYSWICRYFVPSRVTSDNGTEFEEEFKHLLARLGIKHINTSACHPAANGVVERLVGSFKSMLERHVNSHPIHLVQSVPVMRQQYWACLHQTLGMSPQEMVYGRQPMPVLLWLVRCCKWQRLLVCGFGLTILNVRVRHSTLSSCVSSWLLWIRRCLDAYSSSLHAMHGPGPFVAAALGPMLLLFFSRGIWFWRLFLALSPTWVMVSGVFSCA
jgi:hypothetical protein